ncbi:DUF4097 family beta strand repeat-containing protein [Cellulomonas palmilytica]|uniref:DUF4097 family beta strand repeat-containing protein n=1 Tax=Cellulomonas palmilytica TaxID=2608402 RepID=UPI001F48BECB|nr:DUF4097 family beta strand repeat-containing protein [Cellulomonas palmilytica]UJP40169.1 DUF4097 family beta strand repeat protein [Cellulomonas palmilytica]
MSTVIETPAPPAPARDPRRSAGAKALLCIGGTIGALAIAWAALDLASLIAREKTSGEGTYAAAGTVELVADGRVTVTAGGSDEVHVAREARFAFADPHYSADTSSDRLTVSYTCAWSWLWQCDTDLDVTLPADTTLVVRSSNGDVRATGVLGDADLRSGNGRVEASALGGDLVAHSSNGSVEVTDVAGSVRATSDNGSVVVHGAASVEARSSNGRVEVEDVDGVVIATSDNGGVQVADARDDITARSSNGDVTVYGTGDPVALDIHTSNGGQRTEAPTDPAADVKVVVRSSNGSVSYLPPRS